MSDEATEEADGPAVPQEGESGEHSGEGHGEPDKSAKQTEDEPKPSRAEVSNYEIVGHWFRQAAEQSVAARQDDVCCHEHASFVCRD